MQAALPRGWRGLWLAASIDQGKGVAASGGGGPCSELLPRRTPRGRRIQLVSPQPVAR